MSVRWLCVALIASGCAFDTSGSHEAAVDSGTPLSDAAAVDASNGGDGSDWLADATPGCVDEDDDGFYRAIAPGALCGPADCDDADEDVYPGQTGAFTAPKSSGDFDYNCDGVEQKLSDTRVGGGCHADIFGPCEGTGWIDAVPDCGEAGTWHRCESGLFTCDETERVDAVMPCV